MDLRGGAEFIRRISKDVDFRTKFSGYYTSTAAVLVRLGAPEPKHPIFFLDKIERLQQSLKMEEKRLAATRREVTAREDRIKYFRATLEQGCAGDWDAVIGYESRIPALPPQPTQRGKKVSRSVRTSTTNRVSRKRKLSASHAPTGETSCLR